LPFTGEASGEPWGGGIASAEFGYYDSEQNRSGNNPLVKNSELRYLLGYEHELANDFTGSIQYYLEQMLAYGAYHRNLAPAAHPRDEYRHVLTFRLTKLLLQQNLRLSLFAYYSPSDRDAYLRPQVHYQIDDHWAAEIGGNIFAGSEDYTFFGQFEKDTNVYLAARYGF
jgi:hypothetical protein